MYAVTGRKVPTNYVDIINAQSPYLPALYRQRDEDKYRQQQIELEEKGLALDEESLAQKERELATMTELEREALEQSKKQARQANLISLGNLGVKAGLGIYGDKIKDFVGGTSKEALPTPEKISEVTALTGASPVEMVTKGGVSEPMSWTGKATDWGKWGEAITSKDPWIGGTVGTLASRVLTDEDDKWYKKAAIGAGAGALTSAVTSGGDLYSTVLGGIFGGGGSFF